MKSSFCFLLGLAVTVFASTSSPDIEDTLSETVQMPVKEQEEEATETNLPSVSIEQTTPQIVPLYQYWNPRVHDHFYTQSIQEIGVTTPGQKGLHGYIAQGVACHLFSAPSSGVVPLHRYYHGGPNANHFYTTNAGEIGTTIVGQGGRYGYVYEGVAGYCYNTQVYGTSPLYRYYGGRRNGHFYTKGPMPNEVAGYTYQRIQCYVY